MTHQGAVHDFSMLKTDCPKNQVVDNELFRKSVLGVDLGYQGIAKLYEDLQIEIPHKRPKKTANNPKSELT